MELIYKKMFFKIYGIFRKAFRLNMKVKVDKATKG